MSLVWLLSDLRCPPPECGLRMTANISNGVLLSPGAASCDLPLSRAFRGKEMRCVPGPPTAAICHIDAARKPLPVATPRIQFR